MGITIAYGAADPAGGAAAIRRAYELGVTLFDTAALALTADDLAEIARSLPRGGFGARLVPVWE